MDKRNDYTDSPLMPGIVPSDQLSPGPPVSLTQNPSEIQPHPWQGDASPQQAVTPRRPNTLIRFKDPAQARRRPDHDRYRQLADTYPPLNPPPPVLSLQGHHNAPATSLDSSQTINPSAHNHANHLQSTPAVQASMPSFQTPTLNTVDYTPDGKQGWPAPQGELLPQQQPPQALSHYPHDPISGGASYVAPSATNTWNPPTNQYNPLNAANSAIGYGAPPNVPLPVRQPTLSPMPQPSSYNGTPSLTMPPPTFSDTYGYGYLPDRPMTSVAATGPGVSLISHGGLMQTHQVKSVPVFTGNAESKMLIDDWIRDMQYLLEAIELPTHLRFATVVRHLSGEARKLVLNLPLHEQTPAKAFEELRAEYGDTRGTQDPLADFYECSQRPGESACSFAIALEATLRAVEESQRGGRPFPDRDSKLTRQFLRGLTDEAVYARISPMKPSLLSFRELQAELRDLARENKRFQPHNKSKKTYEQVHVTSDCSPNIRAERTKHVSELAELTEIVKKLALSQEEQMTKLSHLEAQIKAPTPVPPPRPQLLSNPTQNVGVTCYRCGKSGHIARVCRAVFPNPNPTWTQQPAQPMAPADGNPPQPTLNH